MRPLALARAIARLTLTKKAENVVLLDLRGVTSMADYFVVCSADSDIQVNAIARAVEEGMESQGISAWHSEKGSGNWVLLDFVDVVLHVFHKHARQFYSLEKLWGDAKITAVSDDATVQGASAGKPRADVADAGESAKRPVAKSASAKLPATPTVRGAKRPVGAKTRAVARKRTRPAAKTTKRTKAR